MNLKVLIVGSATEVLSQTLKSEFLIQKCQNPDLAFKVLAEESFDGLVCLIEKETVAVQFLQQAVGLRRAPRVAVFVPPDWTDAALALGDRNQVLFLSTDTRLNINLANLRRFLHAGSEQSLSHGLLEKSATGTVTALYEILSIVDPYSASLGQRLRYAADFFCKSAGFKLSWEIETGALLAEIGVLTVPVRVIMKMHSGQELSTFEREMLSHVPERGADLLQQIPFFSSAAEIVRYQGKNFDGSGLPSDASLAGERIPLGARLLKVLGDLFKFKENGQTQDQAIATMEHAIGRYDPSLLRIARDCFKVSLPENVTASTQPLTVKELRPGQLLVSNVETEDGVLVIRDGQVVSPRLLHKLRNFACTSGIREPIYAIDLLESRAMTTTFHNITQSETTFVVKA